MKKDAKIFVAGHNGLVGSAIFRFLKSEGFTNIITRSHSKLDLANPLEVASFFKQEEPEYVFLAAAKVGGIVANNKYRADFMFENIMIQTNVIHQSYLHGVKKLLFLGSTCIYPKQCPQPIKEEYLLTGPLEYTNEPYAIAKIAGMKMCENYNLQYHTNFISVMPTNLYGLNDNFDLETSHVLPAIMRKIHLGKALEEENWQAIRQDLDKRPIENIVGNSSEEEILNILDKYGVSLNGIQQPEVSVEIWGSGKVLREFLWSEDMAEACVFLMNNVDFEDMKDMLKDPEIRNTHVNIGSGEEISIRYLTNLIKKIIGFRGELFFNSEKPEGTLRKVTDTSKLEELGWRARTRLEDGIEKMYLNYISKDSVSMNKVRRIS